MATCSISLEADPLDTEVRSVIHALVQFNGAHAEPENWQQLILFLRDDEGAIRGGLLGHTHWQWLFISHLWVAEALRGQGYGRSLMLRAQEEALHRGCANAHLDTFDFQARGFYERLGYTVFGQLADYPPGHTRYFLRKALRSGTSGERPQTRIEIRGFYVGHRCQVLRVKVLRVSLLPLVHGASRGSFLGSGWRCNPPFGSVWPLAR